MLDEPARQWQRDSNEIASEIPGAVHCLAWIS